MKQFYAFQGLFFGRLISLNSEMNIFQGLTNVFEGESAFGGWVDTFFDDDFDDIGSHVVLLELSLLVGNLKFASFENDLDDLLFGFVGEELVEIGFFGDSSMRGILIDFLCLEYFRNILFDTVSPVEGLVTIAGNFEVFFVDVVTDGGDICQFDVCDWLFQHCYFTLILLLF